MTTIIACARARGAFEDSFPSPPYGHSAQVGRQAFDATVSVHAIIVWATNCAIGARDTENTAEITITQDPRGPQRRTDCVDRRASP